MGSLRADLRASIANEAALAAQLVQEIQRADRAEAEAATARESLTAGHRALLAENECLRKTARSLRGQLDDAMGYSAMELGVIDAGGEKALAAAQLAAHAAAAKASTT
jgi:hypothetical protein